MEKEISRKDAQSILYRWLDDKDNIKITPIYRKFLQPLFSSLLQDSRVFLGYSSLRFKSRDKVATIVPGWDGELYITASLLNKGKSATIKTIFDICCTDYHPLEKAGIDITIIQNVLQRKCGKIRIDVEEEHRSSLFNSFGLEQEREQETFKSSEPLFVNGVRPNTLYARDNNERGRSIYCANIVPCSMKQQKNVALDVCGVTLTRDLMHSTALPAPIMVEMTRDYRKEDKVFFPYFHDADGWIITEPFLKNDALHLSCAKSFGLDEKFMGQCHKIALANYLLSFGLADEKVEEGSQSLLLRCLNKEN